MIFCRNNLFRQNIKLAETKKKDISIKKRNNRIQGDFE